MSKLDVSYLDLLPVTHITHLVDFFLCEENDSSGCNFVRGWVGFLNGTLITPEQAGGLLFNLRADYDVYLLFITVGREQGLLPTTIVMMTVDKLTKIYQEHDRDE